MSNQYKKLEKQWSKFILDYIKIKAENRLNKLKKDSDKKYAWDLHWKKISSNPNLYWEYIEANLDKPWDWEKLSSHENITIDIIKDNPDQSWNLLDI